MADLEETGARLVLEGAREFIRGFDDGADAQRRFALSTNDAATATEHSSSRISVAAVAIGNVIADAFMRGVAAIGQFVGDSLKLAGDFEQTMAVIEAGSGAPAETMERLRAKAVELGADLRLPATSAVDAGQAMLELSKNGLTVEESMEAARGALLLSAAAQIDEARAAEITSQVLNVFNLTAKDSEKVVDLLTNAAAKGAGGIEDYAQGFQQAGFAFNAAKQPADALATSLQILIENGLTGSDAGTALKNAMIRLMNPTKQASKLMESLGINVYDANGNMRPMEEIIGTVNKGLSGMTQEQRNAALGTIFLSDGMKAMIPLLEAGTDGFNERKKAVTESGAAEALAAAQTKGWNGAQEALKSQLETIGLVLGQVLIPVLTKFLNEAVIPVVTGILALVQAFIAATDKTQFIKDALDSLIPGAGEVVTVIQNIVAFVSGLIASFQRGGEATDEWAGAFQIAGEIVATVVNGVQDVIDAVLPVISTFIAAHGEDIKKFFSEAWERIHKIIELALAVIDAFIGTTLREIAAFIRDHGTEIQQVLSVAWEAIKTIINVALTLIEGILNTALAIINGDWEQAWAEVEKTIKAVWELIKPIIESAVKFVEKIITDWLKGLVKQADDAWTAVLVGIGTKALEIKATAKKMVDDIISFFNELPGRLAGIAGDAISALISSLLAGLDPIRRAIADILAAIANIRVPTIDLNPFDNQSNSANRVRDVSVASALASQGKGGNSYSRNYNLNVNAMQSIGNITSDFAILEAMAS